MIRRTPFVVFSQTQTLGRPVLWKQKEERGKCHFNAVKELLQFLH